MVFPKLTLVHQILSALRRIKKVIVCEQIFDEFSNSIEKNHSPSISLNCKFFEHYSLNFEKISQLEGWGKLSAENLKNSINKTKNISLEKFIYSLGIRHIGQENAKILAKYFQSIKTFKKLIFEKKNLFEDLLELDGIGETQINSLKNFFSNKTNKKVFEELIKNLFISDFLIQNKGKFINKTFMFTGGMEKMSRSEAKQIVENECGKVLGSPSKKLDYLVAGDSKPTLKKINQAKDLGIKILKEKDWYKLINF